MTEDSTDGRPWPIDPIEVPPPPGPLPIPELVVVQGVSDLAAAFSDPVGDPPAADQASPRSPLSNGSTPVTDHDRAVYGVLLDRAAERELLSQCEYEVRLRELAEATGIDQMRRIVTELPMFTPPPVTASPRSRRAPRATAQYATPATVGRRRSSPWVLLGIIVLVVVASLVFLSLYLGHMFRNHNAGVFAVPAVVRALSALRL